MATIYIPISIGRSRIAATVNGQTTYFPVGVDLSVTQAQQDTLSALAIPFTVGSVTGGTAVLVDQGDAVDTSDTATKLPLNQSAGADVLAAVAVAVAGVPATITSKQPAPAVLNQFTVASSLPTITTTDPQASGSTITSAVAYPPTDAAWKTTGTPIILKSGGGYYVPSYGGLGTESPGYYITWEIMSDATQAEIILNNFSGVGGFDLFVDGFLVQAGQFTTAANNNRRAVKLDWAADANPTRQRHYRIAGKNLLFGGMYVDQYASAWFPLDRSGRKLLAVLGDSYTDTTGADSPARVYSAAIAATIGYDYWPDGIGGSGWRTTTPNTPVERISRGIAGLTRAPDVVLTALGYNDATVDPTSLAQVAVSYAASVAAIRAAWPATRVITLGPWTPAGSNGNLTGIKNQLIASAAAAGVPFVDIESIVNSTNKARYTGGDNVHPTNSAGGGGHQYLGRRIASRMTQYLP